MTSNADLIAAVEAVRALHVQGTSVSVRYNHEGTLIASQRKENGTCAACSRGSWTGCCRDDADECDGPHSAPSVPWPCPTLRAIENAMNSEETR